MARWKSDPEVRAEIEKLTDFFAGLPDGAEVAWKAIEDATGIHATSNRGHARHRVRIALRELKRPYEAVRGVGIRLSAPTSAITIVRGKFSRINGALRVAERTQSQLQDMHLEQMSSDDQRKMLIAAGFFGAVRAFASEARVKLVR
jgi:ATP/maltotriose-dependent transcriptional regulator MalT